MGKSIQVVIAKLQGNVWTLDLNNGSALEDGNQETDE